MLTISDKVSLLNIAIKCSINKYDSIQLQQENKTRLESIIEEYNALKAFIISPES